MDELHNLLTAMRVMDLIGIAIMAVWFIQFANSEYPKRADTALRNFLARSSRRA